jgi:hypothetical protein
MPLRAVVFSQAEFSVNRVQEMIAGQAEWLDLWSA